MFSGAAPTMSAAGPRKLRMAIRQKPGQAPPPSEQADLRPGRAEGVHPGQGVELSYLQLPGQLIVPKIEVCGIAGKNADELALRLISDTQLVEGAIALENAQTADDQLLELVIGR